jgi:aminoglycoside phosphotransferase (APT) family kinase protein
MLDAVLEAMHRQGLLSDPTRARCNVFVRLDNVLANVFDPDGRHYYLRMAEAYDLEPEYQIAQSVASSAGRFVPQPIAFLRTGKVSCIVVEGIKFSVVRGDQLLRAPPRGKLARELIAYLSHAASNQTSKDRPASIARLVDAISERYDGTEQEGLLRKVLAHSDLDALSRLPSQRQHGDFVPNNFGMRPEGLVVFDWEDFGRIDLPGFDLAVLVGSLVDFEPKRLQDVRDASLRARKPLVRWLDEACRAAGLSPADLMRALPLHLALFMWLKDRYSPAIRLKVNRAIVGLL